MPIGINGYIIRSDSCCARIGRLQRSKRKSFFTSLTAKIEANPKTQKSKILVEAQWLKQAQSEIVWERLISPAFEQVENDLPKMGWQQVLDVAMPDITLAAPSAMICVEFIV